MKKIAWWVAIFVLFSLPSYAQTFSQLYDQEQAVDKKNVESFRFSLDPNQPKLGGMNEKFLVLDQLGRRWLFKIHQSQDRDAVSLVGCHVAQYLDVLVPQSYIISLTLNGKKVQGTITLWVDDAKDLKNVPPATLSNNTLNQILHQQVLDHLLANFDVRGDNFLLKKETGIIYGIDKDYAFDYWGEELPLVLKPEDLPMFAYFEDYYMQIWKEYTLGTKEIDFDSLLNLIVFVDQFDSILLKKLVEPAFKYNRVKKTMGSPDTILKRKANTKQEFLDLFTEAKQEKALDEDLKVEWNLPTAEAYSQRVKEAAQKRISEKKKEWLQLKANIKGTQKGFTVVSSRKAWKYLVDNEQEGPEKLLKALARMVQQTNDPKEKEGIQLYQKQIESWEPNNPSTWDLHYELRFPANQ